MNREDLEKKKTTMGLIAAFALATSVLTVGGTAYCYAHIQTLKGHKVSMSAGLEKEFASQCRADKGDDAPVQDVANCTQRQMNEFENFIDESVDAYSQYGISLGLIALIDLILVRTSWRDRQAAKAELARPEIK